MRIFVNRDDELKSVGSLLLDAANLQRIAVVCADTGMGKTALLDEIYDRHRANAAVAFIDVGRTYDLLSFLGNMADQLTEQGVRLSAYQTMATKLAAPQPLMVEIRDVQANSSPIDIAITATSESRQVADLLLKQLLTDIETEPGPLRRLVLIDRYEQAGPELKSWFGTSFIPSILFRSATVCVMAGCHEPTVTSAEQRRIERLPLQELDAEHISQWLAAAGVPQAKDYAEFLWQGTKGVPGIIQPFIANLVSVREGEAGG